MSTPFSKGQIDRLGDRLRAGSQVESADREMLQQLRATHDEVLESVANRVSNAGLEPSTRLKTVTTIIEKLQREPRMRLSRLQDIAGARIVDQMTLSTQDRVTTRVAELLQGSRIVDRRDDPSYGYRAVHVIAPVEGCWVEIQIRTRIQHSWAEVAEKLADLWGRQIRYGDPPDEADQVVRASVTRREVVAWVIDRLGPSLGTVEVSADQTEKALQHGDDDLLTASSFTFEQATDEVEHILERLQSLLELREG